MLSGTSSQPVHITLSLLCGEQKRQNLGIMKTRILQLKHSINRSSCPRALLLVPLALACFSLSPTARAVTPAPAECPPNFNARTGCHALYDLTTGVGNAALGWHALAENSDASFSTGIGAGALSTNSGDSNTAVGAAALFLNTTGTENVAVGTDALLLNDGGSFNSSLLTLRRSYFFCAFNSSLSLRTASIKPSYVGRLA